MESLFYKTVSPEACNCTKKDVIAGVFLWTYVLIVLFQSNFYRTFVLGKINTCLIGKILWVLLNRAPTSTQLHPPPPSSFQPPPSSLQHLQQYLNQNIARNWAISPNLDHKIKSCPFWLKIGTYGILKVLIPNPDLDFWNFDLKMHFWANLDP